MGKRTRLGLQVIGLDSANELVRDHDGNRSLVTKATPRSVTAPTHNHAK